MITCDRVGWALRRGPANTTTGITTTKYDEITVDTSKTARIGVRAADAIARTALVGPGSTSSVKTPTMNVIRLMGRISKFVTAPCTISRPKTLIEITQDGTSEAH